MSVQEIFTKEGGFVPNVKLKAPPMGQPSGQLDLKVSTHSFSMRFSILNATVAPKILPTQRYKEGNDTAIRSGAQVIATAADDAAQDGALDVSLAELSLGQRLASTSTPAQSGSLDHHQNRQEGVDAQQRNFILKTDAPTLTRTLTQALHSNDTPLLESVLAKSSRKLIAGTVQRLQPQYALPLIMACVERMNRGARAGKDKGRGGGAAAQRAELMVRWIRAVLVAHTAHLLTVPDLVTRLSALHTSLTQRLALQDRLLSLNGRLDLILSQIEHRAAVAPASRTSAAQKQNAPKDKKRPESFKYVEGESSDEAREPNAMEVDPDGGGEGEGEEKDEEPGIDDDVEEAEDEGSVEDVELGASDGQTDGGSDYDDEVDDDSGEGEDEDESPPVNGFLDIEAEESSDEGDSMSDQSDE